MRDVMVTPCTGHDSVWTGSQVGAKPLVAPAYIEGDALTAVRAPRASIQFETTTEPFTRPETPHPVCQRNP